MYMHLKTGSLPGGVRGALLHGFEFGGRAKRRRRVCATTNTDVCLVTTDGRRPAFGCRAMARETRWAAAPPAAPVDELATISFFRIAATSVPLERLRENLQAVRQLCNERGVVGTVILAADGLNGTLAGDCSAVRQVVRCIAEHPLWGDAFSSPPRAGCASEVAGGTELVTNEELCRGRPPPYKRLKVKVKAELIALDLPSTVALDLQCRGTEI
eukprot:COSAG02_NODE_15039_length_1210_cov_1.645365_1_plen_213_part_10